MAKLLEPTRLGTMALRNRVVMAPMCMYSCFNQDGMVDDFHVMHYSSRSYGGVGLVICEATAVDPESRISMEDAGLWNDQQILPFSRVVKAIHQGGAKAAIQLAHAGRKSRSTTEPVGPMAEAFSDDYPVPRELHPKDIDFIANQFAQSARRAVEAGFDAIEVHGAHGYLISTFLSPLSNKRPDEYGKDRLLFLEQILSGIREVIPSSMPLLLRVSGSDWTDKGNSPESLGNLLAGGILTRHGITAVHVSSGGVVNVPIHVYPGFQIPLAHTLSQILDLPIIGGGMIDDPSMAESIVQDGRADFIFLARALLREPHWVLRASRELNHPVEWPKQYERGKKL
jgi:NADPH2 dehydrogenase